MTMKRVFMYVKGKKGKNRSVETMGSTNCTGWFLLFTCMRTTNSKMKIEIQVTPSF